MAWDDWDDDDYDLFHDRAYYEVFNQLDLAYMNPGQVRMAENIFERGWLDFHIPAAEKEAWRKYFYNFTSLDPSQINWETYRELYEEAGG